MNLVSDTITSQRGHHNRIVCAIDGLPYFYSLPRSESDRLSFRWRVWLENASDCKDLVISERAESEWNGETEVVFACRPLAVPEKMLFAEHHFSHAASTFYPSPFEEAAANLASSRRRTFFWNSFSPIHIGIAVLKDLNPRDANAR
jgi:hypothetical protein